MLCLHLSQPQHGTLSVESGNCDGVALTNKPSVMNRLADRCIGETQVVDDGSHCLRIARSIDEVPDLVAQCFHLFGFNWFAHRFAFRIASNVLCWASRNDNLSPASAEAILRQLPRFHECFSLTYSSSGQRPQWAKRIQRSSKS